MENEEIIVKKSHKGLIILVILLVLVILGLVGYICYDKGLIFQKQEDVVKEEKKEEDNKVSSSELEEIRGIVQELSNNFAKYYPLSDLSKIDNQELLLFAIRKADTGDEIGKKDVEDVISKYFGNSVKVVHEDIKCPSSFHDQKLYLYEDGEYELNNYHGGHGGPGFVSASPFYVSSEKDGNIINVNYKILYSNVCNDTCILNAYYRTYEDSINSNNPVLEGDNSSDDPGVNLTEDLYKSVEEKIPVTSFKFEKTKNNTYNLKSVSINE